MKQILVMMVAVVLVGQSVVADDVVITDSVLKEVLGKKLKKPYGKFAPPMKLTEADYEKVTSLGLGYKQLTNVKGLEKLTKLIQVNLSNNQLTDVTGLEKLTQVTVLQLYSNPDLTKAQIDELQKALPNCRIYSDHD